MSRTKIKKTDRRRASSVSLPADLTAQVKLYAGAKNMKVSRVHEVALTNFFLDVNEKENER